jgi:hypothetical protein
VSEKRIESSRAVVSCTFVNPPEKNRAKNQEPRVENGKEARETKSRREMEIDQAVGRWVRLHRNKSKTRAGTRGNRVLDISTDLGSIVGDCYHYCGCYHSLEANSSLSLNWNPSNWKLQRELVRYLFYNISIFSSTLSRQ